MSLNNYLENNLRRLSPQGLWVGLATVVPNEETTSETIGEAKGCYRVELSKKTVEGFQTAFATAKPTDPLIELQLEDVSWTAQRDWGLIVAFYIADAPKKGNVLFWGELDYPKTIKATDTLTVTGPTVTLPNPIYGIPAFDTAKRSDLDFKTASYAMVKRIFGLEGGK